MTTLTVAALQLALGSQDEQENIAPSRRWSNRRRHKARR
jgi:hypothetical protein